MDKEAEKTMEGTKAPSVEDMSVVELKALILDRIDIAQKCQTDVQALRMRIAELEKKE